MMPSSKFKGFLPLLISAMLVSTMLAAPAFASDRLAAGVVGSLDAQADFNDSMASAHEVEVGRFEDDVETRSTTSTTISTSDGSLWYKFKTRPMQCAYVITLKSDDGASIACTLSDTGGEALESASAAEGDAVIESTSLSAGAWYYVRLQAGSAEAPQYGKFTLGVDSYPVIGRPALKGKAAKATKKSLTLKWSKAANAANYSVSYRAGKGKWVTKGAPGTSITLTKLKANTKYSVKVRAYCFQGYSNGKQSDWGAWSATKTFKTKAK